MPIIPLNQWIPKLKKPLIVAGPCSAETEEQVLQTAKKLAEIEDVRIFRAGIWKPRTRPNSFEGLGEEALPWLAKVKKETGLLTTCEVANTKHVELALKYGIDILWIGARTTVSPFAVQEIADALKGTGIPVMIKNPINADFALWMGAVERFLNVGIEKIVAIHRGFSSAAPGEYRNPPMWHIPLSLKQRFPDLPMICDPSHITGKRENVPRVCQKAMDLDMDGLIVETHPTPEKAWSDAAQQITPETLASMLKNMEYRTAYSSDRKFEAQLGELRSKIDRLDTEIIETLQLRNKVAEEIAKAKIENNVTAFQLKRMDKVLKDRKAQAEKLGLRPEYIEELYNTVHAESVKIQTSIMVDNKILSKKEKP
jgi:chorismate mutase